ncbi:MAG TPA: ABC transporter permease subunit [Acetobacteraceae bacterium]|jgi:octopine/nopaline transport system permease protein|nr:ABC transporter permease subunit [Acetobacteraceae bacterium]
MDFSFLLDTLLQLVAGTPLALELAASSIALGAVLGLVVALLRLSRFPAFTAFGWLYVQVVRAVPLMVLLFLIYYGVSQFPWVRASVLWPVLRDPYWCTLIALTINTSSYASEIIRGGLLAVPRGEIEAGRCCGMSGLMLFRRIILPVAIRQALPAYSNEMIAMVKATSLASLVTLMEVTGIAASIASETYRPIEVFVAAGAIYLAINFVITRVTMLLEHHLTPHLRARQVPRRPAMAA